MTTTPAKHAPESPHSFYASQAPGTTAPFMPDQPNHYGFPMNQHHWHQLAHTITTNGTMPAPPAEQQPPIEEPPMSPEEEETLF